MAWFIRSLLLISLTAATAPAQDRRIDIYDKNPWYWQYDGKPVVLLGGSVEDNLFQIPDLEAHLDLLKACGGNVVRNTMSCRDDGNVWPFKLVDGKYDLDLWNDAFWSRFEQFLQLTEERSIIVQIELWDGFDYYLEYWDRNPFNPRNTISYTAEETGLPLDLKGHHPLSQRNPFFKTISPEGMNGKVFAYQKRLVEKTLSYSLKHGNVLYCMDNETAVSPMWGEYWSSLIKDHAQAAKVKVHTTEMWDPWDLRDDKHKNTYDRPDLYSFVDVSQNNHNTGQEHWDRFRDAHAYLAKQPRPMNNTKIYGADTGKYGTDRDGIERFWRNIFAGAASARFHRPASGLGLNETAQAHIRSLRMFTDAFSIFTCSPRNELLAEREDNEAYCTAELGSQYAVFFTNGGEVVLDVTAMKADGTLRWLDVAKSEWLPEQTIPGDEPIRLSCPEQGYWAVLIKRK